eukprot:8607090-Heterocapsa_arctica.AAC.1
MILLIRGGRLNNLFGKVSWRYGSSPNPVDTKPGHPSREQESQDPDDPRAYTPHAARIIMIQ